MGRPQQRQSELVPFASILEQTIGSFATGRPGNQGCRNSRGRVCELCWGSRLDYTQECRFKAEALARWADQVPSLPPPQWIASPVGRHYRSLSKRRWLHDRRQLVMVEGVERGRIQGIEPAQCQVEPQTHATLYQFISAELRHSSLSRSLNYVVIKTGGQGEVLVLNLTDMHSQRSELNRISKKLTHHFPQLRAIWLVQGHEGDEYYANIRPGQWQKLYGEGHLIDSQGLHYSPLCFSQVNPSCVQPMLQVSRDWLGDPALPLVDLYSGYGLFSLGLGRTGPTWGLEVSGEAVLWARRNARRLGKEKARFEPWDLGVREIPQRRLPSGNWVAVIDPPRGGAPPEVISGLAQARPRRVMHWICDSQQLSAQLKAWIESGYRVTQAVAVDMFAGTSALELGLCLEPGGRLRSAKPGHLIKKSGTGTTSQCKPPKKPAPSPATSTGNGARPKRPKP